MKAKEIIKELKNEGWYEDRQKGSHRIFKHARRKETIVIPDHGKKDIPIGTLKAIRKLAGLK